MQFDAFRRGMARHSELYRLIREYPFQLRAIFSPVPLTVDALIAVTSAQEKN